MLNKGAQSPDCLVSSRLSMSFQRKPSRDRVSSNFSCKSTLDLVYSWSSSVPRSIFWGLLLSSSISLLFFCCSRSSWYCRAVFSIAALLPFFRRVLRAEPFGCCLLGASASVPEVAPRLLVEVGGVADTVGSTANGLTGPSPQTLETSEMRDSSSVTALEVTPLVVARAAPGPDSEPPAAPPVLPAVERWPTDCCCWPFLADARVAKPGPPPPAPPPARVVPPRRYASVGSRGTSTNGEGHGGFDPVTGPAVVHRLGGRLIRLPDPRLQLLPGALHGDGVGEVRPTS